MPEQVVCTCDAGRLYIIDVNYFPSFKGINEAPAALAAAIRGKLLHSNLKIGCVAHSLTLQ